MKSEDCIDPEAEDYHDDCIDPEAEDCHEEQDGRDINREQNDNTQEDNAQEDNAQEQEQHHEGRFSYSEIHIHLASHKYPLGFSKANKLALQKRWKFFQVKDGHLYYTGKCKLAAINSIGLHVLHSVWQLL